MFFSFIIELNNQKRQLNYLIELIIIRDIYDQFPSFQGLINILEE